MPRANQGRCGSQRDARREAEHHRPSTPERCERERHGEAAELAGERDLDDVRTARGPRAHQLHRERRRRDERDEDEDGAAHSPAIPMRPCIGDEALA